MTAPDEIRDELPEDLNVVDFAGAYEFPDNSRRRRPGVIYLLLAAGCVGLWLARGGNDSILVNRGYLLAAGLLGAMGLLSITSGWHLGFDEKEALSKASASVGFPIGHASAQMAWRGLRSRPVWRVLAYSIEEPPRRRAFVVLDGIDGSTVEQLVEDNPEDWANLGK